MIFLKNPGRSIAWHAPYKTYLGVSTGQDVRRPSFRTAARLRPRFSDALERVVVEDDNAVFRA